MNFANVKQWFLPNNREVVRVIDSQSRVIWEKNSVDYTEPFYVENKNISGNPYLIIASYKNPYYEQSTPPIFQVEYSYDKTNWNVLGTTGGSNLNVYFNNHPKIWFRANTDKWYANDSHGGYVHIIGYYGGVFDIGGNIMSLLYGSNFTGNEVTFPTNSTHTFLCLFKGFSGLQNANQLILPATTLVDSCYGQMFAGCSSLISAPTLPARTMTKACYSQMFEGCTSLTTSPALPATTMAQQCYSNMFEGCTSLVNAPDLPATTLGQMCYGDMFEGCTSLVNAPDLPATTLAYNCYWYMFWNCTSLVNAPDLPATTLTDKCYDHMFYGCSSLKSVKCLATSRIDTNSSTRDLLTGASATGTFTKKAGVTWPTGANGIPSGWTVVEV